MSAATLSQFHIHQGDEIRAEQRVSAEIGSLLCGSCAVIVSP